MEPSEETPSCYPLRRACLLRLFFITVVSALTLPLSFRYIHSHKENSFFQTAHILPLRAYTPPAPQYPSLCLQVGQDPHKQSPKQHNLRFLCMTSAMCIRPNTLHKLGHLYFSASADATTCNTLNPDFSSAAQRSHIPCQKLQRDWVFCSHGRYANNARPQHCPPVSRLSDLSEADNASSIWVAPDRVAIVIPAFPWIGNIFHYSFVIGHLTHVLADLDILLAHWRNLPKSAAPTRVSLIFRGDPPSKLGAWNAALTSILLRRRVRTAGIVDASIHTLHENPSTVGGDAVGNNAPLLCAHSAVLLGRRGNINLWPFPNSTEISLGGHAVPAQAVAFRRAVYDEFNITHRLPRFPRLDIQNELPSSFVFDVPPLVIGYSHRPTGRDPPPGGRLTYNWRRFSQSDEAWFEAMLHEEGRRVGATVREINVRSSMPFGEQVRWFSRVGLVVGIHGANLVNAMFSPPFGVLVEVKPGELNSHCYAGGENSGLAYFSHMASPASRAESFCHKDQRCWINIQHRRVKIDSEVDRMALRRIVREGLAHLTQLRRRFPNGIHARLELPEERFVIDETRLH